MVDESVLVFMVFGLVGIIAIIQQILSHVMIQVLVNGGQLKK